MKKKIVSVAIVAAVAVAAAWGFNQSKNEVALSDVALSNVEALASDEGGGGNGPCDAGGVGASSCSISQDYGGGFGGSKSVTCSSGYYACCTKDSWGNLAAFCVANY